MDRRCRVLRPKAGCTPTWAAVAGCLLLAALPGIAGAALPAAAGRDPWFRVASSHLVALTNAEPGTVAGLLRQLEALRETLGKGDLGLNRKSPVPLRLVVFRDLESFAPYNVLREDGSAAAQAYFNPAPDVDYLAMALPDDSEAAQVTYHEFLHAALAANAPRSPLWLGEGLAEYYETFHVRGATATIGDPLGDYFQWLNEWLEEDPLFGLRHLFAIDTGSPEYVQQPMQTLFYAQSWALTHMLAQEGLGSGRFRQLLDRLADGRDPAACFDVTYGAGGYDSLLTALRAYIESGGAGARSHQLAETIDRLPVRNSPADRRDVLVALGDLQRRSVGARSESAREHYEAALARAPGYAPALVGLGQLAAARGDSAKARQYYQRALASDPRDADALLWAGLEILQRSRRGDPDWCSVSKPTPPEVLRARGLLGHSLEQVPGRPAAESAYAATYNFEWGEPARACLRRLQRATAGQAAREDVLLALVALAAQAGERREAGRIVESRLAPMQLRPAMEEARRSLARADLRRAHEQMLAGRRAVGVALIQQTLAASDDAAIRREALRLLGRPGDVPTPIDPFRLYDEGNAALERDDWNTARARFEQVRDTAADPKLRAEAEAGLVDVAFYTGLEKTRRLVDMGRLADARAQLDILGHLPLRSDQRGRLEEIRKQLR
jgi:tetratricopeptide (TPR) repeat protein